jgi:hypothetical protein
VSSVSVFKIFLATVSNGFPKCHLSSATTTLRLITLKRSQNCVATDGQSASLFLCQAPIWVPRLDFYHWRGALSLTRGHVCSRLLLGFASASIPLSESRGTCDHISLFNFEIPPTGGPGPRHPGTGWPSYIPRHCVPFSLLPRTLRAMVDIFEPIFTLS